MASEFSGRPRLQKGALLVYASQDAGAPPAQRIDFAFNPEQLKRSFAARTPPQSGSGGATAKQDTLRVPGPPVETITLSLILDATGRLEEPEAHPREVEHGLHHQLAALELLLYPDSHRVAQLERQTRKGVIQVAPAQLPLVVLAWGTARVMPVQVATLSITEELFDPNLNPIRAKVELGVKVLTYVEFPRASAGREAYIGYQRRKEQLAGEAGSRP